MVWGVAGAAAPRQVTAAEAGDATQPASLTQSLRL
jgi:hypothetical protein